MRMYLEGYRAKEINRAFIVAMIGLGVIMFTDFVFKEATLLGFGGGIVLLLCGLIRMVYVGHNFGKCAGGVLEVLGGKIVAHYAGPFCYKVKDLAGAQLVPITFKPFTVIRTLRVAVRGEILLYQIACTAMPLDAQLFYDTFLRPNEDGELTPEDTTGRRIEEFLITNAEEIRLFYYQGGEQCVLDMTQVAAEQQLTQILDKCGLQCIKAVPTCKIEAMVIS